MSLIDQLQKGTYGGNAEIMAWSFYDSFQLKSTANSYTLFQVPVGAVDPSTGVQKKLSKTNMTGNGGSMPQAQNFEAHGIKFHIRATSPLNTAAYKKVLDVIANSTIRMKIQGKDNLLLLNCQEAMGIASLIEVVPTASGDYIQSIQPRVTGLYRLNIPVTIAALTSFELEIVHHVPVDSSLDALGIEFMVSLEGQLVRGN